jgi:hypothetical protein
MAAMLVRGTDRHGNFQLSEPPRGAMEPADLARYEAIAGLRTKAMLKGAKQGG